MVAAIFVTGGVARAEDETSTARPVDGACGDGWEERVAASIRPSVVRIKVGDARGSGFLWGSPVRVATAAHVVDFAETITVAFANGEERAAHVFSADRQTDVALLDFDGPPPVGVPLASRDPATMPVGSKVALVGHPLAHEARLGASDMALVVWSVTSGVVTGRNATAIGSDAAADHGTSGGPMVDCGGRVVGVVSRGIGKIDVATSSVHLAEIAAAPRRLPWSAAWIVQGVQGRVAYEARFSPDSTVSGPSLGVALLLPKRLFVDVSGAALWSFEQTSDERGVVASRTGWGARAALGRRIPIGPFDVAPTVGGSWVWIRAHRLQLTAGRLVTLQESTSETRISPGLALGSGRIKLSYAADLDVGHLASSGHVVSASVTIF